MKLLVEGLLADKGEQINAPTQERLSAGVAFRACGGRKRAKLRVMPVHRDQDLTQAVPAFGSRVRRILICRHASCSVAGRISLVDQRPLKRPLTGRTESRPEKIPGPAECPHRDDKYHKEDKAAAKRLIRTFLIEGQLVGHFARIPLATREPMFSA